MQLSIDYCKRQKSSILKIDSRYFTNLGNIPAGTQWRSNLLFPKNPHSFRLKFCATPLKTKGLPTISINVNLNVLHTMNFKCICIYILVCLLSLIVFDSLRANSLSFHLI